MGFESAKLESLEPCVPLSFSPAVTPWKQFSERIRKNWNLVCMRSNQT